MFQPLATPKNEKKLWAEMRNIQFCLDYLIIANNTETIIVQPGV